MADNFFNCPYTRQPCSSECVAFVREHNQGYATYNVDIPARKVKNYCRVFGQVDRESYQDIRKSEDGS